MTSEKDCPNGDHNEQMYSKSEVDALLRDERARTATRDHHIDVLRRADAALKADLARERARALENRGIETPCSRCGGLGVRAYASTATWSGGMGGNMITSDVCDHCWGSGDEHRKWVNLRDKQADLARERARADECQSRIDSLMVDCADLRLDLRAMEDQIDEVRKLAVEQMTHDGNCRWVVLGSDFGPCNRCSVLAILDRKLDAGGSVAGEAEPLSGDPPANSDRSAR